MERMVDPWRGKRVLAVLHTAASSPREVGRILSSGGATLDARRPALGEPLPPDPRGYDAVAFFGGPMSANDGDAWIRDELAFMGATLDAGVPLLGVCLGGQLLAKALGARVARHPAGLRETGFRPVWATDGADGAWRSLPGHVFQWHEEGFDLPRGAVRLAGGEDFPNQAFRYGNAVGIQFHAEADAALVSRLNTTVEFGRVAGGAAMRRDLEGLAAHGVPARRWLSSFLSEWLPARHRHETLADLSRRKVAELLGGGLGEAPVPDLPA